MRYKKICQAILKKSRDDKTDYRDLFREWVNMFEKTGVVGWDRDEFLDDFIKCKEDRE